MNFGESLMLYSGNYRIYNVDMMHSLTPKSSLMKHYIEPMKSQKSGNDDTKE